MIKRIFLAVVAALLILANGATCFSSVAYGAEESSNNAETILCNYLDGKNAATMTGTPQDGWIRDKVPNCNVSYYAALTDELLAMSQKKEDFLIISTVNFNIVKDGYPSICQTEVVATKQGISYLMNKTDEGAALKAKIDTYINKISESGELERLQQYWLFSTEEKSPVEIPKEGENGVLKLAISSSMIPYAYKIGDEFAGFEVDILAAYCRENGYGLEIDDMEFSGILSGVTSGKYDLGCSGVSATEERLKSVYFCEYTYEQSFQFVMRAEDVPEGVGIAIQSDQDGALSLGDRLYNNFVKEGRWKLLIKGGLVTLGVTVLSTIFGTLLGYVICRMRLSSKRFFVAFAKGYIYILSGMPLVLLLLIFCFVIFAKSNIDGFYVAVTTFSFYFSAVVAETLRTGIELVDPGQKEAMYSLGYDSKVTFRKIVLPQGVLNCNAIYRSQIIKLLKDTSIVGYIAVQDVTKVADIIRSRTFDAFIPLIFAGIVYFLVAGLLIKLMGIVDKKVIIKQEDPKKKLSKKKVTLDE